MKQLLIICALIISLLTYAQQCDTYLLLKEGASFEYTNYDRKGKAMTVGNHLAKTVGENAGVYTSQISLDIKDLKKGDQFNMEYEVGCENGILSIDMSRFFDSSKLMQYEGSDFDIAIEGDMLYFPKDMTVGEQLNNGTITVKVVKDGFTLITMTMDILNRMVLANETITTDAGTFECQKVSYDFESKFGIIKVKGSAQEWYHKDRLLIKSESYNKKGKLIGSTALTGIKE